MKKEDIRKAIDNAYEKIKHENELLKILREDCKHEENAYGNYMWAPGHINHTRICKICDATLGQEGSYTFKFLEISKNKEALTSIVKENFLKTGMGNFVVFSDTQEPSIDFEKEIYTITTDPQRCINFGKGNYKMEECSPEECKVFADTIKSVCQKASIKVEILPYILHL